MFYSNSSFFLYFCNTVALVLWRNKILIGFSWKNSFSKCSSCVRPHLKAQSLFSDIHAQGWSCGGRNGAATPSVLMMLQVLHVVFVTQPTRGAFTIWTPLAHPPGPNAGALHFICSTDTICRRRALEVCWPLSSSIDARILWPKESCLSRDISI